MVLFKKPGSIDKPRTAVIGIIAVAAVLAAFTLFTRNSPGAQSVPTDPDTLFAFLQDGTYRSFSTQEAATHPSAGPHTSIGLPVRVFMNDALATSLAAGNPKHPVGSSVVKELYEADGQLVRGWAVMVKTTDEAAGGENWFWYEVLSSSDPTKIAGGKAGNGIRLCSSCHEDGTDHILTKFPLK